MAAPIFKKNKVSQTINLKDEFGLDFRGKDSLKQAIGQAIIDQMLRRTAERRGMSFSGETGRPVKLKSPYSKDYVASLPFRAAGKSKGDINMRLSGGMLDQIDITKVKGNSITIGWDDTEENNKAFNHSTGDTVPRRPFFGVNKAELKKIKKEFGSDIKEAIDIKQKEGKKAFDKFVLGLLKKIDEGEDILG